MDKRKALDMVNLIFACWLTVMPALSVIFGIFMTFGLEMQLVAFGAGYFVYLIYRLLLLRNEVSWRDMFKKAVSFPCIFAVLLFLWLIVSAIIHGKFPPQTMYYMSYFFLYICFRMLDKKTFKTILYIFTSVMLGSVILSLMFPSSMHFPGFPYNSIGGFSMQFANPNYSAYVVSTLTVVCAGFIDKGERLFDKIFFSICFVAFSLWLYCNGSFVPIACVYLFTFILIVYRWIKNKRCPVLLLSMFFALFPLSFIVDACPWWTQYRNATTGFIKECFGVIDNIFHTHINSEPVAGADGWGRKELVQGSIKGIFYNTYTFFIGYGAGTLSRFRPHMQLLSLWVELGVFAPVAYAIICVWTMVKYFKSKCKEDVLPFFIGLCAFFVMSFFGSMLVYTFMFIVPLFAICHKLSIDTSTICEQTSKAVPVNEA